MMLPPAYAFQASSCAADGRIPVAAIEQTAHTLFELLCRYRTGTH
ncbi:MAG TPA: hypothetical protein VLT15_02955 [Acidimicrobiia bacterium]|nr:hypothetical protein [Acidimicrobiia bacterium]